MIDLRYPLILASNSPRRQELLTEAGIDFKVEVRPVEESLPDGLNPEAAAKYIAEEKLKVYKDLVESNIVICADTIVVQGTEILGKPQNEIQAYSMLNKLSGNTHKVITAVVIAGPNLSRSFTEVTEVTFERLNEEDIIYYIENFKPLDKAGSYGIQEWIGLVGIKEIHGSYFNVVGLPVNRLYKELKEYFV